MCVGVIWVEVGLVGYDWLFDFLFVLVFIFELSDVWLFDVVGCEVLYLLSVCIVLLVCLLWWLGFE